MTTKRIAVLCGAAALVLTLAGCASPREPEFGSSVRHLVEGQTYDPAAPRPELGAVDGRTGARAVDAYHEGKAAAKTGKASGLPSILMPTTQ